MKAFFTRIIKNKKLLIGIVITIVVLAVTGGYLVYQKKNSINGTWKSTYNDSNVQLNIDGKDAAISFEGSEYMSSKTITGTVDKKNKKLIFHDSQGFFSSDLFKEKKKYPDYKMKYQLISKQLVVTSDKFSTTFTRNNNKVNAKSANKVSTDKKSHSSSVEDENTDDNDEEDEAENEASYDNEDEDYYLDLGDYEVGSEVKAGPYKVTLHYYTNDLDSESGSGSVIVNASNKKEKVYKFNCDDYGASNDIRIILHEGDMFTLESDGGESEFNFMADTDVD